jgi:hypothetical protein
MRPGQLALAAVMLLGWAGGTAASPLIPTRAGASLQPHSDIEAARWRHRHSRGYFWGERRDADRDDRFDLSLNGASRFAPPDVVRPDPRRRGWVDPPPAR